MLTLNADGFVGKPTTNDPSNEASQIWSGQMSNGDTIVGFFNRETSIRSGRYVQRHWRVSVTVSVRDLWQHANMGQMNSISVDLPAHGSMVLEAETRIQARVVHSPSPLTRFPIGPQ